MRRFPLPETWHGESECVVSGKAARKLAVVLRLGPGDGFPAIAPDGALLDCTILSAEPNAVRLTVHSARQAPAGTDSAPDPLHDVRKGRTRGPSPGTSTGIPAGQALPAIRLAVSILKGHKLDEVVRAATEAGTAEILLLRTERCVVRPEGTSRTERLRRIAEESMAQSGTAVRTRVMDPVPLRAFLELESKGSDGALRLFCHETPLASGTLHQYCTGIQREVPGTVTVCVGPEGGFSPSEVGEFLERGFLPVNLGPAVLRAETAAVFAIAALRVILLERSSWQANDRNE